ncbi:hypothetical protein [Pontibacter burrus]|uniref:Uncharacterized protein n=1 Tax=Pontibacter burrus TaxID=2704466 RepID=A0A6B3LGI7_9BACT|nr:hypothetical protein [Pontibacter burrus]NEM96192.1 hypothetical protein [Pontibacter burrus]
MDHQLKTACLFLGAGGIGASLALICLLLGYELRYPLFFLFTLVGTGIFLGIGVAAWCQWHEAYKQSRRNRNALKG